MSRTDDLLKKYGEFISIPWQDGVAAPQRIVFAVYPPKDELRLRAHLDEFKIETKKAGHTWEHIDLTDSFPEWLSAERYAESYYNNPDLLQSLMPKFIEFIDDKVKQVISDLKIDANTVFAISGIGTLFELVKVKDVVEKIVDQIPGRLLVLFPGTYENNNYRLLDGYDGWNYLATSITTD